MDEFFLDIAVTTKRSRMDSEWLFDLGMAAVSVGSTDISASFRKDEVVGDGSSWYAGG